MPASDKHPLYRSHLTRWELARDCVEGSVAVKNRVGSGSDNDNDNTGHHRSLRGTRYLPQPNPTDASDENHTRYQHYRTRASFVNFTGHTKDGFLGMVYRKPPEIELDPTIDFLHDNADGEGLTLLQMLQGVTGSVLEAGRHGLLADFPPSDGGTIAQTQQLQAKIKQYPAESIINWRTAVISSHTQLVLVVLAEEIDKIDEDGFSVETVTWHRVLLLKNGIYVQQLFNEDDEAILNKDGEQDIILKQADGSPWTEIPFAFIGSIDNSPTPDKAPLYDLAEVNISHYRNSADNEESSFLVGQPTPVFAGLTQQWAKDMMQNGVQMGSRAGVLLPEGASAQLLQANANQMPAEGMVAKEQQMIKIGAKIITDSTGVETAEAAKLRFAGQNSKLSLVINNVELGFLKVLAWAGQFMPGGADNVENKLIINRQFYEATVNPQLLVALMQLNDRGVIAKSDLRNTMRKSSQIEPDRTDEDIDAEISLVNPLT